MTAVSAVATAPLARFVQALEFLCEQGFRGREFVRAAEPAMRRLLLEGDFLPEEAKRPSEGRYARHLLHRDAQDRFVVAAMVWKPGQGTPIHDHDGTWGMLGMLQGGLEVVNYYAEGAELAAGAVPLRSDPPHAPRARHPDCVCACADIHQVANKREETAVSIHVYPRDLEKCHVFNPLAGEGGRFEARTVSLSYSDRGPS